MLPAIVTVANQGDTYHTAVEARQHRLAADEPTELGGTDTGSTPGELLLTSLGACAAMTVRMYARRKGWPLTEVRVKLWYDADARPDPQTTVIQREIELLGPLDVAQRQRLLQIGQACPIHKLLTGNVVVLTTPGP